MILVFGIGIICIVVLVNNLVSILNKVRGDKDTGISTFLCCISLIFL